ncbi:hypothetical protein M758_5G171900 [Ceratodon purpureus]|nr:hypothetical protein M758_5G171900 [Ceratodon purpureus]
MNSNSVFHFFEYIYPLFMINMWKETRNMPLISYPFPEIFCADTQLVAMAQKTIIRNRTAITWELLEGSGGEHRKVALLEPDKEYKIHTSEDSTDQEFHLKRIASSSSPSSPSVHTHHSSLLVTSDDLFDYSEIEIIGSESGINTWKGTTRNHASRKEEQSGLLRRFRKFIGMSSKD